MKFIKQRLEALSDGVIAIILTIMMFSIPVPKSFEINDIMELLSSIIVFLASFTIVAFQWYKHNYLLSNMGNEISNRVVWYNFMFLFSISLIPIFTKLVIENPYNWLSIIAYFSVIVLVNTLYMTLSNCVENIKESRGKNKRPRGRLYKRELFLLLLSVLVIIVLAIFKPRIASFILIILPVLLSIFSMWSFGEDRKPRETEIS